MTAYKNKLCQYEQRGASILEVILSSAIILIVTPFLYNQIVDTTHTIQDINTANKIISLKDAVINYVRLNQNKWPDVAQIKMDDNDVKSISNLIHTAFIDQYQVMGATVTDVYLAFDLNETELRTVGVAKHIGQEASVVSGDGVAYGETWAVTAPDFKPGDLIYRVSRDFDAEDKLKYLHRGTMGEDNLNTMQRDLYMGYSNIFNVGTIDALFADLRNIQTTFVEADYMEADTIYFSAGANMNAEKVSIGSMRVTDDINGFRTITTEKLNDDKFTTTGRIITDKATINESINVASDMILKSESSVTIDAFTGVSANTVYTPALYSDEIRFGESFGLTVSGELLRSSITPLQIGAWSFPYNTAPTFKEFTLERAKIPESIDVNEFKDIMSKNWQVTQ